MGQTLNDIEPALTKRDRCVLGAIGGLLPIVIEAIGADFGKIFYEMPSDKIFFYFLGYLTQAMFLMFLGGFVALQTLHALESVRWKAVVAGVTAPVLLTDLLSRAPDVRISENFFISSALAQSSSPNRIPTTSQPFCINGLTSGQVFWRGLTGRNPQPFDNLNWIVWNNNISSVHEAIEIAKTVDGRLDLTPAERRSTVDVAKIPINYRIFHVRDGEYVLAFAVWLTEQDIRDRFRLFLRKVDGLPISPIPFFSLRDRLSYATLADVPNCLR